MEAFFGACDGLFLVAEHGGWRRGRGAWEPLASGQPDEVESLHEELRRVVLHYPGALIERKTWSLAFHFRKVALEDRDAAEVEVEHRVHSWLSRHPGFEELRGAEVLEVRPSRMDKASAVPWLREHAGDRCRLLALGDDVTDEDMFRSLAGEDESIVVGSERDRPTAARWRLDGVEDARLFLKWMIALRRGDGDVDAALCPRPVEPASARPEAAASPYRLLVVSNRLPELRSAADTKDARKRNVGGLVSALEPALSARQGVWLGWSGRTAARADATRFGLDESAQSEARVGRFSRGMAEALLQRPLQQRALAAFAFVPESRAPLRTRLDRLPRGEYRVRRRGSAAGRAVRHGLGARLSPACCSARSCASAGTKDRSVCFPTCRFRARICSTSCPGQKRS